MTPEIGLPPCSYTVFGLEVTFFKHLEMTEKQNKLYLKCLYLQEYKKGFAFLTKFHYLYHRKLTQYEFEKKNFEIFFFKIFFFYFEKKNFITLQKGFLP